MAAIKRLPGDIRHSSGVRNLKIAQNIDGRAATIECVRADIEQVIAPPSRRRSTSELCRTLDDGRTKP